MNKQKKPLLFSDFFGMMNVPEKEGGTTSQSLSTNIINYDYTGTRINKENMLYDDETQSGFL